MDRDDIIRMAREAKCAIWEDGSVSPALERFAALVAAAEREKLKHELLTLEKWKGMALAKDGDGRTVQEIEREAREAEREECAKIAFNAKTYLEAAHLIRERGAP
jgi:Ribonuclease G/E